MLCLWFLNTATPRKTGVIKNMDNSGSILHRQECRVSFGIWLAMKWEWGPHKWAHGCLSWLHGWGAELLRLLYASLLWHPRRALLLQHSAEALRQAPGSHTMLCTTAGELDSQAKCSKGVHWQSTRTAFWLCSGYTPGVTAPGWVLTWAAGLSLCRAPKSSLCW